MHYHTSLLKKVLIGYYYLVSIEILSQDVQRTWYRGQSWLFISGIEEKHGCLEFSPPDADLTSTEQERPFLEDVSGCVTVGRNRKWPKKGKPSTPFKLYYLKKILSRS